MSNEDHVVVEWFDAGREAENEPNPDYPFGIDIDATGGRPGCWVKLPYPAQRCGGWIVTCKKCHFRGFVTAAGRPDDPKSIKIPCLLKQDNDNG